MTISLFQSMQKSIALALNDGTASVESKTNFLGLLFELDDLVTPAVLNMRPLEDGSSQADFMHWLPALVRVGSDVSLKACAWACVENDSRGRPGCTIVIQTPFGSPKSQWYPITQGDDGFAVSTLASRDAAVPPHCDWFSIIELPTKEYSYLTYGTPFHKGAACYPFFSALAVRLGLIRYPEGSDSELDATKYMKHNQSTMGWFNLAMHVSQNIQISLLKIWDQKLRKEISMLEDMHITLDTSNSGSTLH